MFVCVCSYAGKGSQLTLTGVADGIKDNKLHD